MLSMIQQVASYIYAQIRNTKYIQQVRKKEEEQERRERKGREVPGLKLQKGWERLSGGYREKVGNRCNLDSLYSCMKLAQCDNFLKESTKVL